MRSKALLWIAVVQVAAGLGTALTPVVAHDGHPGTPTAIQTICARVQEPSATALRLAVDQMELRKTAPDVPWTMLLALVTLPLNIVLWHALWRVIRGDGMAAEREQDWSSRTIRRQMTIPEGSSSPAGFSFPSSMTLPRR